MMYRKLFGKGYRIFRHKQEWNIFYSYAWENLLKFKKYEFSWKSNFSKSRRNGEMIYNQSGKNTMKSKNT